MKLEKPKITIKCVILARTPHFKKNFKLTKITNFANAKA